jgi:hypothetical protein
MKRVLIYFGIGSTDTAKVVPETLVDSVLVELTKRAPQTVAEKEFHKWLVEWKRKLDSDASNQ